DPCVSAFQECLFVAFGPQNVHRVTNGSPIPKWKVWTGNSEVTFSWANRWPTDLRPLPTTIEISADGTRREVEIGRPKWLRKMEECILDKTLERSCRCVLHGFLPEVYLELRFAQFPNRKVVVHLQCEEKEFKNFMTRIAARLAMLGPDRTYAGEMKMGD
ncbi:MAG: hypothetical protein ACK4NX_02335, partial [Candidatus Paceibacteria bacterium]